LVPGPTRARAPFSAGGAQTLYLCTKIDLTLKNAREVDQF
jgi:hypothetical protein